MKTLDLGRDPFEQILEAVEEDGPLVLNSARGLPCAVVVPYGLWQNMVRDLAVYDDLTEDHGVEDE